jgi:hypothetical protein
MPQFYFDVRFDVHEGSRVTQDEQGLEFADLKAVEHQARITAADLVREHLASGKFGEISVEARDEHRKCILIVSASMRLDWLHTRGAHGRGAHTTT